MKTITIEIPVCECGCEGDMWIQLSDGVLDFAVCHVCGRAINPPNNVNRPDACTCWLEESKHCCPLFLNGKCEA